LRRIERVREGADVQRTSAERRTYHRNLVFGISNGSLTLFADTLIHPTIVLALFVSQISDNNLLVGLVPALAAGVWFLPQMLAAALTQGRSRQLPFIFWSTILRTLAMGLLAMLGYTIGGEDPSELLVWFFVLYSIYNLMAGFSNVPMLELSARMVPADRRGFFFSQRNFWGGVLGFMAGFVVQRIVGDTEVFPLNFALLFLAAFCVLAFATYSTAMIQEPRLALPSYRATALSHMLEAPQLFANHAFRRFLGFRVTLSLTAIADPFYVVFIQQQLGAPPAIIGLYVVGMAASRFGSNLLWGRLVDTQGNRAVLQIAALMRMSLPIIALVLPPLFNWEPFAGRVPGGDDTIFYLFGLIFVIYGAALSGQALANMTYVLDVADPEHRPAYVGLTNTILAGVAFVPVLGGVLVDAFGFEFLFIVTFLIGFVAVVASGMLHEPRVSGHAGLVSMVYTRYRRWRG
jgi:hypothetical protein